MNRHEEQSSDSENKDFLRLLMSNQNRIYAFILTLVPNWSDADDIMQETAETMWSKFGQSQPINNFGAWGIKIAQNKIFNFYSKKKTSEILLSKEILEDITSRASCLAEQTDERINALEHCLGKLRESDRRLIQMKYEQNITIKELAVIVERPVQGLYKAISRIHNALLGCIRRALARGKMI